MHASGIVFAYINNGQPNTLLKRASGERFILTYDLLQGRRRRLGKGPRLMTCYNIIGIYFLLKLRSACFSSGLRPQEIFGQCSKAAKSYRQALKFYRQFAISSSHVRLSSSLSSLYNSRALPLLL